MGITKMIEDEKYIVIQYMKKYGGSFVQSLANCLEHADPINTQKMKDTFQEYWNEYLTIGIKEEINK